MNRHGHASALEGVLEAVWLVDVRTLGILWVNAAACNLLGLGYEKLVGMPAVELTSTPEDMFFWEDVAAGVAHSIHSDTFLRSADGIGHTGRAQSEPGCCRAGRRSGFSGGCP